MTCGLVVFVFFLFSYVAYLAAKRAGKNPAPWPGFVLSFALIFALLIGMPSALVYCKIHQVPAEQGGEVLFWTVAIGAAIGAGLVIIFAIVPARDSWDRFDGEPITFNGVDCRVDAKEVTGVMKVEIVPKNQVPGEGWPVDVLALSPERQREIRNHLMQYPYKPQMSDAAFTGDSKGAS